MTQAKYTLKSGMILLFGQRATATDSDRRVLGELQAQLVRLLVPMACVNVFNALVVALAFSHVHGPLVSFSWAGVICAFGIMQILKGRSLSKRQAPKMASGSMLRTAELTSYLLGGLWGCVAFVFATDNHLQNMFLNIVVFGMAAGTAAILGPLCRLSARFIVSSIPIVFLANIYTDFSYAFPTFCLGSALIIALVVGTSRNAFHIREMVKREVEASRAEADLSASINASNDAFAFYGAGGELILANERHKTYFDEKLKRDYFGAVTIGNRTIRQGNSWLLRSVKDVETGGTVVVHSDVTTMKTRERELLEARREAEEADDAKGRFLSTMSHELRQPLHVIIGNATLMSTGSKVNLSQGEVNDYADDIYSNGEHLLRLIDDIIDYSKVGLGRFMLKPDRIDLRAMIAKSVSLAASFEGIKTVSGLKVSVSPRLFDLHVDEFVCQRILISLLSNAFRFGSEDGRISIKADLKGNQPYISIRDFGRGLPEHELEKVFEAFYQTDNSLTRENGGAGLGLTLCRHLARLHEGDVVLKSRIGAGTNATLVLPKSSYIVPERPVEQSVQSKTA